MMSGVNLIVFLITWIGVHSWYQDFLYRKSITFINFGSHQVDYEVEYYFNTSMLLAEDKIRNNCFDIEFTLNNTKLDFWLEQGCGLSRTTYWLKLLDFPVGNTTILMYYGASNKTSNPGLEWTDRFGFMSSVACNVGMGYTHMSEMENHFSIGDAAEDFSTTYGSDTHAHNTDGKSYNTAWGPTGAGEKCDSSIYLTTSHSGGMICPNHYHTLSMGSGSSTSPGTSLPYYKNYVFCRGTTDHSSNIDYIPAGYISMFEHSSSISSWADAGDVNSGMLYIRGSTSGSVDSSILTSSHGHALDFAGASFTVSGTACTDKYISGTSDTWFAVDNHQHTTSWGVCNTNAQPNTPPYLLLHIRKSTVDTHFVPGMITFQYCGGGACTEPPLGWTRYSALDNVFPRGAPSTFTTSETSPSHLHSFTNCYSGIDSNSHYQKTGDSFGVCGSGHKHTFSGTVDSSSTIFPNHRKTFYIQRKPPDDSTSFVDGLRTHTCNGIVRESESVCSGHGDCVSHNNCSCLNTQYDGENCQNFSCGNISRLNESYVCNAHGECVDHETCACRNRYNGTYCTEFYCYGFHYLRTEDVCGTHGECVDTDVCICSENYDLDESCSKWGCFGVLNNETDTVCSGHGECSEINNCTCYDGYGEYDCSEYMCGNYRYTDEQACTLNGECIQFDDCSCDAQYYFNATAASEAKELVVCTHCPSGTHFEGTGGQTYDCELCPLGTYSTVENDDGCVACSEGTYSDNERQGCLECPSGTYNALVGSWTVDQCLPCPRGYYGNIAGVKWIYGCIPCPENTRNPNLGSSSVDDCLPCDTGEICPVGSAKNFPLTVEYLKKEISYKDLGMGQVATGEVTYEFKIIVMSVVFFISMSTICLVCMTSNSCLLCERKKKKKRGGDKDDGVPNRLSFLLQTICMCGFCPTFRTFDWYYAWEHDVKEGESKVKNRTKTGGCFSIVAVSIFSTFLIWSISDFVYGSKKINTSADFYQADETNQIRGDVIRFMVDFYGTFDNCTIDESEGLLVYGLGMDEREYSCSAKLHSDGELIGCSCQFDCIGCLVEKSEMLVRLSMVHGGEYVRLVRYTLALPSFNDEAYSLTGSFFEGNGTCDTVDIDVSLYPRKYKVQSNWNLILGLLDLEQWGEKTFVGIGAGLLSIETNVVHHPGLESVPGKTPFSFNLRLSNFEQIVEEYFPQTLLNFIAQIFSLIGVSISIVGIFFGKVESIQGCCTSICSSFCRKSAKVGDSEKEMENGEVTLASLKKEMEILQGKFHKFEHKNDDGDDDIEDDDEEFKISKSSDGTLVDGDDDEELDSQEKEEEEECVPDEEMKRISESSSSESSDEDKKENENEMKEF